MERKAWAGLERADAAIAAVRTLPPRGAFAREMRRLRRAEIHGSTAFSGSHLSSAEVDALLDRDRAVGNHPFGDYVLVRAYADAAGWIADLRAYQIGDPRPLIAVDEVRALNARATVGTGIRGGAWRQGNPVPAAGIVAPAAWLVTREITTLLDRFARGPRDVPIALWLARFLARFGRLQPFEGGNGRTARLAANTMLRRLDGPPVAFEPRERTRYAAGLAAAQNDAPDALAGLVAGAIVRGCNRMIAAASIGDEAVESLRILAGDEYTALAKAAQRGRLRTVVRGGRYFTTAAWIADYRATRSSGRGAPRARPAS